MIWPAAFEQNILQLLKEEAGYFFDALNLEPVTSVHLNQFKQSNRFLNEASIPWNAYGRALNQRPSFILDPYFHAGAYYVQESSSQFLAHVLKQVMPKVPAPLVLDLCAAPGGKSMHLLDALQQNGTLLANEIIKSRLRILEENLQKKGLANVFISNNDPADFEHIGQQFDLILVDAPCSGEGLFRRDAAAAKEWSESAVNLCVGRQQRILAQVLPSLKEGGVLIYATCTYNRQENEENVNWLIQSQGLEALPIQVPADWPVREAQQFMFRFFPHLVNGEGLFMAVLQKPRNAGEIGSKRNNSGKKLPFVLPKHQGPFKAWLNQEAAMDFVQFGLQTYAIPKDSLLHLEQLWSKLRIVKSGIRMGTLDKQQQLIPDHDLALSIHLSKDLPHWELDNDNALAYLRKQNLEVDGLQPKGWNLVSYAHLGLGFAKVLPGRMNNYLPSELRIIKASQE